jgi:glycoside hydrolase-like protein
MAVVAATPTVLAAPALNTTQSACSIEGCINPVAIENDARLVLPAGKQQCRDSGPAAACATEGSPADYVPGTPAEPAGQTACTSTDAKPIPTTPAACSEDVLQPEAPTASQADRGPRVAPSVPIASLSKRTPPRLSLTTSADTLQTGGQALLTATASSSVTDTTLAIEIYDLTSGTLIGACGQGSTCSIAYSATSGTHDFAAYLTPPTVAVPDGSVAVASNHAHIGWLDSGIVSSSQFVGQGQAVTLTATSSVDVQGSGRWLEIYDLTAGARITYCSRGTTCTTTLRETSGGIHKIVGYINGQPEAVSDPIYVTWLDVSLSATSIGPKTGGTIYLKATTNTDLTNTPYVVGIYDENGRLVDHACKTGSSCNVQAWMSGGTTPRYTAVIGSLAESKPAASSKSANLNTPTAALVDVQAKSTAVEPTHLLWGVDSCKAFVGDPSGQQLYQQVVRHLGAPDFWGRYLTNTVCPGISPAEVALAASHHMGILPIYNDYNCSAVSYYPTGRQYAAEAAAAAQRIGIPSGRLLAIDIEPYGVQCPGAAAVDAGFIGGWYDGVRAAGYFPVFYGNSTQGTEFARAWCAAVAATPSIATGSHIWSFEPSLLGYFSKAKAPSYSPFDPGCPGSVLAWQYRLSGGTGVDVDQDEAISSLPLWFP